MGDGLFLLGKLAGLAVRAESWLVLLAVLTYLAARRGRLVGARRLAGLLLVMLALLAMYPLGDPLLALLEGSYPRAPALERADRIVVLGGAEDLGPALRWGGSQFNGAGERLTAGLALARRFPDAQLIFTGGVGAVHPGPIARMPGKMARALWEGLGVAPDRIVIEDTSRNTAENARDTLALLGGAGEGVTVLVTSAFHMPRAMETFTRAGWRGLVAWPVDYRSSGIGWRPEWKLGRHLSDLDLALKEHAGILGYRLAGY